MGSSRATWTRREALRTGALRSVIVSFGWDDGADRLPNTSGDADFLIAFGGNSGRPPSAPSTVWLSCAIQLLAAAAGPAVYGILHDVWGGYGLAILIAAGLDVIAAGIMLFTLHASPEAAITLRGCLETLS